MGCRAPSRPRARAVILRLLSRFRGQVHESGRSRTRELRENRPESGSFRGTGLAQARLEEFLEMVISKAAVGFLVGAGIAAGAGGAYIASRPSEPVAVTAGQASSLTSTASPAGPVEQSEAVVNDPPAPAPVAEVAAAPHA